MARDYEYEGARRPDEHCQTAKELLDKITAELAKFDAKKLVELKTDLTLFVAKQDGLVADYKAKFPALRKLWCDRQLDVERLCSHIRCEFPLKDEKWKKLIEDCICKPYHDLCCLEQRIAARRRCCTGKLERARDAAQAAFDTANARLTWLSALAARIDAILTANLKTVGDIEKLAPTERAVALYLFWFKLLPSHKSLTPYDASAECRKVCSEGDPGTLCCDVYKIPCPEDDCGCTPKDGKPPDGCSEFPHPEGPWLMCPDKYKEALDCAWEDYYKAKEALGEAAAALAKSPDDLPSLVAKQASDAKGLEDAITKCLKNVKLPEDCCHEHEPKKGGC